MIKSYWKKKKKRENNGNRTDCVHKSPSIKDFGMEFTACLCELMPEGAMTPFTACDAYRYFAGRALLMASQK